MAKTDLATQSVIDEVVASVLKQMGAGQRGSTSIVQASATRPSSAARPSGGRVPRPGTGNPTRVGFWVDRKPPADPAWCKSHAREIRKVISFLKAGRALKWYKGFSSCRICGKRNGTCDMLNEGFLYPEGYVHYLQEHSVVPPASLIEAALNYKATKEPKEPEWGRRLVHGRATKGNPARKANKDYRYFVVDVSTGSIYAGNEYASDAQDAARDLGVPLSSVSVVTAQGYARRFGRDAHDFANWGNPGAAARRRMQQNPAKKATGQAVEEANFYTKHGNKAPRFVQSVQFPSAVPIRDIIKHFNKYGTSVAVIRHGAYVNGSKWADILLERSESSADALSVLSNPSAGVRDNPAKQHCSLCAVSFKDWARHEATALHRDRLNKQFALLASLPKHNPADGSRSLRAKTDAPDPSAVYGGAPHAPRTQTEAWQRLLEHAYRYGLPEKDCKEIAARYKSARLHKRNPAFSRPPPPQTRTEAWRRLGEHAERYGLPAKDVAWFYAKAKAAK